MPQEIELGVGSLVNVEVVGLLGVWTGERVVKCPSLGDVSLDKDWLFVMVLLVLSVLFLFLLLLWLIFAAEEVFISEIRFLGCGQFISSLVEFSIRWHKLTGLDNELVFVEPWDILAANN